MFFTFLIVHDSNPSWFGVFVLNFVRSSKFWSSSLTPTKSPVRSLLKRNLKYGRFHEENKASPGNKFQSLDVADTTERRIRKYCATRLGETCRSVNCFSGCNSDAYISGLFTSLQITEMFVEEKHTVLKGKKE